MNRYVFTKHIVIPNDQASWFPAILQVLGSIPDDSSGEDLVVFTYRCFARDIRMWPHGRIRPYFDAPVDDSVSSDGHSRV